MVARVDRPRGPKLRLPRLSAPRRWPGAREWRRWAHHPALRGLLVLTLTFGLCAFLILEAERASQAGARRAMAMAALRG